MAKNPRWVNGSWVNGSWVTSPMGHMGHGSQSDPLSALVMTSCHEFITSFRDMQNNLRRLSTYKPDYKFITRVSLHK